MAKDVLKDLIIKILLITGMVIVVLFLLWGVLKIIPQAMNGLSKAGTNFVSLFRGKEEILVSASKDSVYSGDKFDISWEKSEDTQDGVYSINFACHDDLSVFLIKDSDSKEIACESSYFLSKDSSEAELIVDLKDESKTLRVPFTISFIPDETSKESASGKVSVTVAGTQSESEISNKVTVSTTTVETNDEQNELNEETDYVYPIQSIGKPDLKIQITRTGVLNSSGNFVGTSLIDENDTVAVQFIVTNQGQSNSGVWYFNAILPTEYPSSYPSGPQISLRPGESIQFTLSFDEVKRQRENTFMVSIDPYNWIGESNESNNTSTVILKMDTNGGSSSNGDDPDLTIEITDVGYRTSNQRFIYDSSIDKDDTAAVKFTVENIGGDDTGSWKFRVKMPKEDGTEYYESKSQSSLNPGESRDFTVGFDNIRDGKSTIEVEVDYDDDIDEESESNNDDTHTITAN